MISIEWTEEDILKFVDHMDLNVVVGELSDEELTELKSALHPLDRAAEKEV